MSERERERERRGKKKNTNKRKIHFHAEKHSNVLSHGRFAAENYDNYYYYYARLVTDHCCRTSGRLGHFLTTCGQTTGTNTITRYHGELLFLVFFFFLFPFFRGTEAAGLFSNDDVCITDGGDGSQFSFRLL